MSKTKMNKAMARRRQYKKQWEEQDWAKGWLGENKLDDSDNNAYCAYCRTSLRAHIADLKRHANTIVHKRNVETRVIKKRTMKQFLPSTSLSQQDTMTDLKLTIFVVCHCSINSIDHLGPVLQMGLNFELRFKPLATIISTIVVKDLSFDSKLNRHCKTGP